MTPASINRYIYTFIVLCIICIGANACKTNAPLENKTKLTKEEKMVITLKNKDAKKNNLEYEQAVEAHRRNQAENTRLMMKDAKKEQRHNNRIHKRSLWERLFRRKCK